MKRKSHALCNMILLLTFIIEYHSIFPEYSYKVYNANQYESENIFFEISLKNELLTTFKIAMSFEKNHSAYKTYKKLLKNYFGIVIINDYDSMSNLIVEPIKLFFKTSSKGQQYSVFMDISYIKSYRKKLLEKVPPSKFSKAFALGLLIDIIFPSYHLQKQSINLMDVEIELLSNHAADRCNKLFSDLGILFNGFLYNEFYHYYLKNLHNTLFFKQISEGSFYAYEHFMYTSLEGIEYSCANQYKNTINEFLKKKSYAWKKHFTPLYEFDHKIFNMLTYLDGNESIYESVKMMSIENAFNQTISNITKEDTLFNLMILARISDERIIDYNVEDKASKQILHTYGMMARFILDEINTLCECEKINWKSLSPIIISSLRVEKILEICALFGNMAPVLHKDFLYKYA